MKRTFVGLDFLRFGLAIYLMVFHTIQYFPEIKKLRFNELLGLGGMATSTFFILSGFILAHVYLNNASGQLRGGTRDFLIKRLSNLYPIHIISLILFLAVMGEAGLNHYTVMSMTEPLSVVSLDTGALWFNRVLTLLLMDTWNPWYVTLNPPAWSLSVLLFFYFCFPWMGPRLLASTKPWRLLLVLWVVYLIPPVIASAMHAYGAPVAGLVTSNPIMRLPEFMAGIVFYGLFRQGALQRLTDMTGWRSGATIFIMLNVILAAWLVAHGPQAAEYIIHNGALMPAELLLLLVGAQSFRQAAPKTARVAARLGNTALSIFAIHLALFYLFIKIEKFVGAGVSPLECARHLGACAMAYKSAGTPPLTTYPVYMVCTVIIALFFQEIVVVKVRDAIRRRLLRKAAPNTASHTATVSPVTSPLTSPLSSPLTSPLTSAAPGNANMSVSTAGSAHTTTPNNAFTSHPAP